MADKETNTTKKTTSKPAEEKAPETTVKEEKVEVKTAAKLEEAPVADPLDKLPSEKDAPASSDPLITEPAADAAPAATSPVAPSEPVEVSEKEVKSVEATSDGEGKLAEEIEVLTGEIQALEAKIEQLTNGATSAPSEPEPAADVAPINAPQTPEVTAQNEDKEEAPAPPESIKTEEPSVTEKDFVNKPEETPKNVMPKSATASAKNPNKFSDISVKPKSNEAPSDLNPSSEGNSSGNGSGLAIIGEVIAVFGIIIFVILAISPFFKESIGTDTYQAMQQIGWLSAIGSLAIGLILYVFVKGSVLFKVLLFLLLLVASALFLAINDSSLVSPLLGTLEPLVEFYR